jgi:hypothetical protein
MTCNPFFFFGDDEMKQYYVTVQHKSTGEIVVWLIDESNLLKEVKEDITEDHLELVSVIPVDMPKPILT